MKNIRFLLIALILGCGVSLSVIQCSRAKADEAYFLNLNDTVDYVGMETCKKCHQGHYETFLETGMGSSFGLATKEKSKALFGTSPVYDSKKDMYYLADWVGDRMRITEYRLMGTDTVHKRSEWVTYIIGSGHHTNSHLWEENGYLFQAPLTWYSQKSRWDLPPGFESFNSGFARKIDMECMSCHNAIPAVEKGSVNKFTRVPMGIDCERCHGPGELHVSLKSAGELVDVSKVADRSIVNPARLPWKLQVDVCQRCHLQGNNVLKPGKSFVDFRPGMPLSDVFDVYMPQTGSDEFFMAGHSERIQMSACFKGSNRGNADKYNPDLNFTCITCHNPHVSVRKTNINVFNDACKKCHAKEGISKLKKCSEMPEKIRAKSNDCAGCHMPATRTEDIPHVTVHDHYIRKNYGLVSDKKQSQFKLYAVNEKQPDAEAEIRAYVTWFEKFDPQKEYLKTAEKKISEKKISPELRIHFYYAGAQWEKITDLAGDVDAKTCDAWTCYRLGKAFDRSGQLNESISWYQNASEKEALNPDFLAEYSNALIRAGRNKEAVVLLEKALREHPKNVLLLTNAGISLINSGDIAKGKLKLDQGVKLDPDHRQAHEYLLELFRKTGNTNAATREKAILDQFKK